MVILRSNRLQALEALLRTYQIHYRWHQSAQHHSEVAVMRHRDHENKSRPATTKSGPAVEFEYLHHQSFDCHFHLTYNSSPHELSHPLDVLTSNENVFRDRGCLLLSTLPNYAPALYSTTFNYKPKPASRATSTPFRSSNSTSLGS